MGINLKNTTFEGWRRENGRMGVRNHVLILPVDESDWDEERGTVRVWWQGDPQRETLADGDQIEIIAPVTGG